MREGSRRRPGGPSPVCRGDDARGVGPGTATAARWGEDDASRPKEGSCHGTRQPARSTQGHGTGPPRGLGRLPPELDGDQLSGATSCSREEGARGEPQARRVPLVRVPGPTTVPQRHLTHLDGRAERGELPPAGSRSVAGPHPQRFLLSRASADDPRGCRQRERSVAEELATPAAHARQFLVAERSRIGPTPRVNGAHQSSKLS
jgi:hypothetical protein